MNMDKTVEESASEVSLVNSLKGGLQFFVSHVAMAVKALLVVSIVAALVAAATFCGDIGTVKMDYITYMPFHNISMAQFVAYVAGVLVLLIIYLYWRGAAFMMFSCDGNSIGSAKDRIFSSIKFLQFCLLAFITFGIILAALVFAAVKFTAWIWIAVGLYLIVFSVPLYVSEYEYMTSDSNFRSSLRSGFKALKEQWGRVFLRLMITVSAAALLVVLAFIPAFSMMMAVYDNATAVMMEGLAQTPSFVYVLEFLFIAIGVLVSLIINFVGMSVLNAFYKETKAYSKILAEARNEEM